MPMLGNMWH